MPNKEEKPAMMHPINLDLSQQLSPGSSQAGSQQQRDPIATSRSAKTRTESSSSTIASRTRRRLSGECLVFSYSHFFLYENNTPSLVRSIFHVHQMPKKRGLRGLWQSGAPAPPLRSAYLPVNSGLHYPNLRHVFRGFAWFNLKSRPAF